MLRGSKAAGSQIVSRATIEYVCWDRTVSTSGGTRCGSEPVARSYAPFEDHTLPSKLSSDVRRQYERRWLCTVNSSRFDWSTSRLRISTKGLTVVRELGPSPS